MQNYIDVKVTVWKRFHFAEESNMKGLAYLIQEESLEEVIDGQLGFLESEVLFNTEENLNPAENAGQATIKVYENGREFWSNT